MHISINTDEGISDLDKQILAVLAGGPTNGSAPAAPAAKAPTAAKKATPAPKAEKPSAPDTDESDPAPESAVEEAEETDEPETESAEEPTMKDAVELATKLVSGGKAADVKKALADAGAKRVSELKGSAIADFVAALS